MSDISHGPRVPSGNPADPFPIVNSALDVYSHQEVYAIDPAEPELLTLYYLGGRWGGHAITDGSVALSDNAENYVVIERGSGTLSSATSTTNWNNATDYARVYHITTASGARTNVRDYRAGPGGVHGQASGGGGGGGGGSAPIISIAGSSRAIDPTEEGSYFRFTGTGAKTATFDVADGFDNPQEFHFANRAASGNLTLTPTGVTLNAPKGGTLVLEPGDTVTVKFYDTDEADVFGSTEAV